MSFWNFKYFPRDDVKQEIKIWDRFNTKGNEIDIALIREAIQNSLDAVDGQCTHVSFRELSNLDRGYMKELLADQVEHAVMPGKGDRAPAAPNAKQILNQSPVTALVIEDYGTEGLGGPVNDDEPACNFNKFWRESGIPSKSKDKLGSHGLGKITFAGTSQLKAFFGVTVRKDDQDITHLMGQSVLKIRCAEDESGQKRNYKPYSYYSDYEGDGDDRLPVPIKDQSKVKRFKEYFKLDRDVPGLSVVIPFPIEEINENRIIKFVTENYFYAVMIGELEVKVNQVKINKDNIRDIVRQYLSQDDDDDLKYDFVEEIIRIKDQPDRFITLKPSWADDAILNKNDFEEEDLTRAIESFKNGNIVAVRLPLKIQYQDKNERPKNTFFDVFIQKPEDLKKGKDMYIRKIMSVSQERNLGNRTALAMMLASEEDMYAFLTASENESHTRFAMVADNLAKVYKHSQANIRIIKNAISDLYDVLNEIVYEEDHDSFSKFFSMAGNDGREIVKSTVWPIKVPQRKRMDSFYINDTQDGFTVTTINDDTIRESIFQSEINISAAEHVLDSMDELTNPTEEEKAIYKDDFKKGISKYKPTEDVKLNAQKKSDDFVSNRFPQNIKLEMAYDLIRGNGFSNYKKQLKAGYTDFDLTKQNGIDFQVESGNVINKGPNHVIIEVRESSFKFNISGFDQLRDLKVRLKENYTNTDSDTVEISG